MEQRLTANNGWPLRLLGWFEACAGSVNESMGENATLASLGGVLLSLMFDGFLSKEGTDRP